MKLTFDEYQKLARRTQNPKLSMAETQLHALHGLAAEIGEIHSIYQKVYQGHQFDPEALKEEIGDALWNIAELCDVNHWRMGDVAMMNISKLRRRYPDGFDAERSVHRNE